MEKIKNNGEFDSSSMQEYVNQAASKAKGLIEWPSHELTERPKHDIVPLSNPDREAERKAFEAQQDFQTMKNFYPNDMEAMRKVKEAREQAEYAISVGKNPHTFSGVRTPGTTSKLVGDGKDSVFTTKEIEDLDAATVDALTEADVEGRKMVDSLPARPSTTDFSREEFIKSLYDEKEEIYDQDNPKNAA